MTELQEVLLTPAQVAERVGALAQEIAPRIDDETVAVCLLTGGMWFAADLTRALSALGRHVLFDAMWLTSYGDAKRTTGEVMIRAGLQRPVEGRRVLLMDDVLDSGLSLEAAAKVAGQAGAKEVLTAVFARKPYPGERPHTADFVAWEAPERFLVGYGMDVAGRLRDLGGVWAAD